MSQSLTRSSIKLLFEVAPGLRPGSSPHLTASVHLLVHLPIFSIIRRRIREQNAALVDLRGPHGLQAYAAVPAENESGLRSR
jgi:hypothetical protein